MRIIFIPPQGPELKNPTAEYICDLILNQPLSYWEASRGEAFVQCINEGKGDTGAGLILVGSSFGFYVLFTLSTRERSLPPVVLLNGAEDTTEVELMDGGNRLMVPRQCFVEPSVAAKVVTAFVQGATCCRPPGNWGYPAERVVATEATSRPPTAPLR